MSEIVLPRGVTVLEASAGTGKTHHVTSLTALAVADGRPLQELLLVTFTRAATGELRDRVWRRLVTVSSEVEAHRRDGSMPTDDVAATICDADPDEVALRARRLARAVSHFDAATISTIHGFCEQVLGRVGLAGDVDRDVTFVEDDRHLVDEVVDDLLVQRFHKRVPFELRRDTAHTIAREVVTDPHGRIVPDVDARGASGMRARFAHAVRRRLERRKRELRAISYDDLLTRLEATLEGPQGQVVRRRLQTDHSFVVVDEFQDTDVVQWNILHAAFADSETSLFLVGDPKQAVYAFRGADVHAYLAAKRAARHVEVMPTNHRSDAGLLRALDAVFGESTLGHPEISYVATEAAPHHREPRLVEGRRPVPLRIRQVRRDVDGAVRTAKSGDLQVNWARAFVADDLAGQIVAQLEPGTRNTIIERSPDGGERRRPVAPGDIAVLVARHADADLVRDRLAAHGVPTVVNGTTSVFSSRAADEWITLLEAIETTAASTRVRSAALTSFLGWSAKKVATADDDEWDRVHDRVQRWRRVLETGSVAALAEEIARTESLPARVLARPGGERLLTDLRHVAERLHHHGTANDTAPTTLLTWLRERRREARDESDVVDHSRRLDTDSDAVQIWTIHRSKGLQFPIVHVPFLWRPGWIPSAAVPVFHDPSSGVRCIDVGESTRDSMPLHVEEKRGEELRLAYVAMTRAEHQVVLWWAPAYDSWESPIGRLLFRSEADGRDQTTPADGRARTVLDLLARSSPDDITIEDAVGSTGDRWQRPNEDHGPLRVRAFDRDIDLRWRRTSYSALTAAAHEQAPSGPVVVPRAAPEHDERGSDDERMPEAVPSASAVDADDTGADVPSRFGDLGGGARFGTMVHSVLEHVDFAAPDLHAALHRSIERSNRPADDDLDTDQLVDGLVGAIETPLGPVVDDLRLRDVRRSDRLDELHFELPLVGGDVPVGTLTTAAIADVVAATLPTGDLLHGYDHHLRSHDLDQQVRGYLSGSIDVVVRHRDRFFVIDHKSNWLGTPGDPLTAWHYRPDALTRAMVAAHYPLQAMLYSVAVHRYLRWRLSDYAPDRHLGGVLYLFLRGMTGPDVPRAAGRPCGVFAWEPPAALVIGLSDVLDRGRAAA